MAAESLTQPALDPHPRVPGRVLVREDVIYYAAGGKTQPVEVANGDHGYGVASEEEPSARTVTVGPDWQPLLAKLLLDRPPSLVHLENQVGFDRQVLPSPEELAAEAGRVVEVGIGPPVGSLNPLIVEFAVIRPGRSCRFEPDDHPDCVLYARARRGTVKLRVSAVPSDDPAWVAGRRGG